MPKNIVICSDGTGNTAVKGRGTNVFRIFESVDLHGWKKEPSFPRQVVVYDDGVGTQEFKPFRLLGGAFGIGLSRNVKQLYTALARVYEPGDRIYLFGFSRGAFTVRTLAGLITECGVVCRKKCDAKDNLNDSVNRSKSEPKDTIKEGVSRAYELHRELYHRDLRNLRNLFNWNQDKSSPSLSAEEQAAADAAATERKKVVAEFQKEYAVVTDEKAADRHEVQVQFVGVWDTVDAVGLPINEASEFWNSCIYCFKFPDYTLDKRVLHAAHALAIDDERLTFHPLLWNEEKETTGRIQQVWFAGAHSNVGGGYPKQGMSLVAMDWMMAQAEAAGLRFIKSDRDYYTEHANVHDHLYNSRSGLATLYRYRPRDIEKLCKRQGVKPKVHVSVLERLGHGTEGYSTGNLPLDAEVVLTRPTGEPVRKVRDFLSSKKRLPEDLLTKAERPICWQKRSRYGLLAAGLGALWVGWPEGAGVEGFISKLFGLMKPAEMWEVIKKVSTNWWGIALLALVPGFFVAARVARGIMKAVFSASWHAHRDELRRQMDKIAQSKPETEQLRDELLPRDRSGSVPPSEARSEKQPDTVSVSLTQTA